MLVHIVADQQNKILRSCARCLDRSTLSVLALLNGENNVLKECDAFRIAADLRNADNILALKEMSASFKDLSGKGLRSLSTSLRMAVRGAGVCSGRDTCLVP